MPLSSLNNLAVLMAIGGGLITMVLVVAVVVALEYFDSKERSRK